MTVHHVFANRSNAGDWLSAQGIQRLLGGTGIVEHLCDEPFIAETFANLTRCSARDVVVIGGGGLLSAYFEPFWRGLLALELKAPLVLWGVGCCDRKLGPSLPDRGLMAEIVRGSRICVVRDKLTRDFLGDASSRVTVVPCPTISALDSLSRDGDAVLHADHFDNIGEENFYRVKAICDDYAQRRGVKSLWTNNVIPAGQQARLDATVALYRSASLVVSSRLHGCIIGLALGCRVIAVSGDRKVESFMAAAGLSDWVCGLEQLDRLPPLLDRWEQQPRVEGFINTVRSANLRVAHEVRALTDAGRGGAS